LATEAFWDRGITITSAYGANAVPVAEYTLSTIILSLKKFWKYAEMTRRGEGWGDHLRSVPGAFRTTVGLVSCGMIARKLIAMMRMFDMRCIVYCPFLTEEEADELGVERCSLEDVFRRSEVVSIHTPLLAETIGLITGKLISSMKPDSTLINTSRGPIIREAEMVEVLRQRPDLTAILDVCEPEPPVLGSPITTLPNVVLTPHIAGSLGPECFRLGNYMVNEFRRYLAGEPLKWQINRELAARLA
jgi:phosphoglycerate dehydrogenase-like enzyme